MNTSKKKNEERSSYFRIIFGLLYWCMSAWLFVCSVNALSTGMIIEAVLCVFGAMVMMTVGCVCVLGFNFVDLIDGLDPDGD
jgi:hypothetical protein